MTDTLADIEKAITALDSVAADIHLGKFHLVLQGALYAVMAVHAATGHDAEKASAAVAEHLTPGLPNAAHLS